jgi:FAD synthase
MTDQILFNFVGVVKKHLGRGKKLGFPTANIDIPMDLPEGIFVGYTKYEGKQLPSLIFIGTPMTFNEIDKKAEIYILAFDKDIYGEMLEVQALSHLRNNEKFADMKALIKQMKKDLKDAKSFFKEREKRITV